MTLIDQCCDAWRPMEVARQIKAIIRDAWSILGRPAPLDLDGSVATVWWNVFAAAHAIHVEVGTRHATGCLAPFRSSLPPDQIRAYCRVVRDGPRPGWRLLATVHDPALVALVTHHLYEPREFAATVELLRPLINRASLVGGRFRPGVLCGVAEQLGDALSHREPYLVAAAHVLTGREMVPLEPDECWSPTIAAAVRRGQVAAVDGTVTTMADGDLPLVCVAGGYPARVLAVVPGREDDATVWLALRRAFLRLGRTPHWLIMDQHATYMSGTMGLRLSSLGIEPYNPWFTRENFVERVQGEIKRRLIDVAYREWMIAADLLEEAVAAVNAEGCAPGQTLIDWRPVDGFARAVLESVDTQFVEVIDGTCYPRGRPYHVPSYTSPDPLVMLAGPRSGDRPAPVRLFAVDPEGVPGTQTPRWCEMDGQPDLPLEPVEPAAEALAPAGPQQIVVPSLSTEVVRHDVARWLSRPSPPPPPAAPAPGPPSPPTALFSSSPQAGRDASPSAPDRPRAARDDDAEPAVGGQVIVLKPAPAPPPMAAAALDATYVAAVQAWTPHPFSAHLGSLYPHPWYRRLATSGGRLSRRRAAAVLVGGSIGYGDAVPVQHGVLTFFRPPLGKPGRLAVTADDARRAQGFQDRLTAVRKLGVDPGWQPLVTALHQDACLCASAAANAGLRGRWESIARGLREARDARAAGHQHRADGWLRWTSKQVPTGR